MISVEQCRVYSAECKRLGNVDNTSSLRATILFAMSHTWTALANQTARFDAAIKHERQSADDRVS
jgi:hypothetical protein